MSSRPSKQSIGAALTLTSSGLFVLHVLALWGANRGDFPPEWTEQLAVEALVLTGPPLALIALGVSAWKPRQLIAATLNGLFLLVYLAMWVSLLRDARDRSFYKATEFTLMGNGLLLEVYRRREGTILAQGSPEGSAASTKRRPWVSSARNYRLPTHGRPLTRGAATFTTHQASMAYTTCWFLQVRIDPPRRRPRRVGTTDTI